MTAVHLVLGILVSALFAAAGLVGGWAWYRAEPSDAFWRLLRAAQVALVIEVLVGGVLLLLGRRPGDDLHYLYGLLPLAVSFAAEQLRISSAETVLSARGLASAQAVGDLDPPAQRAVVVAIVRREIGVMALASLVILGLLARAALT